VIKESVSQQNKEVDPKENENWEEIPKWIDVDNSDEKLKVAVIASSIAKYDANGNEYKLVSIQKRNPEYRKLGIVIASAVNFMYPSTQQQIISIKKEK
jgi:hypothetical protein